MTWDHDSSQVSPQCPKQISRPGKMMNENLCLKLGILEIDLFVFRVSHQLTKYVAWNSDP